ncbi:MAG: outer membrane lipoprotein carrier protein LolA [Bacteroidia bacterium]|nr:MAG: outer membrane lipoprotein carrier protein LolA [Bacteroidia bacterium]
MQKRTMIQKRKLIVLAGLFYAALTLFGQQDSRAERYLQAVSDQFDMNTPYLIRMDYIREDLMQETSGEGTGVIWMKGLKYKIVVDEYIVYYNGKKLYSQNTETEEVYVSEPDPDQPGYLQAVPIRIIKSYALDFKYRYMGNTSFMGKDRVEIQLYPKDITGPYSLMKMLINPGSLKLEAIQLKHKEGILYTMIISEKKEHPSLDEQSFEFDPAAYPNTEIIELLE